MHGRRARRAGLVLLGLAAAAPAPPALAQSMTAGELATHCSSVAAADRQLCYGFIMGAGQLYTELLRAGTIEPMACADPTPTFEALAAVFVTWLDAHPMQQSARAIDGLMQAATETWPCD